MRVGRACHNAAHYMPHDGGAKNGINDTRAVQIPRGSEELGFAAYRCVTI